MRKFKTYTAQQYRINAFMSMLDRVRALEKAVDKKTGAPLIYISLAANEDAVIKFKTESARNATYNEFKQESESYKESIKRNYGIN